MQRHVFIFLAIVSAPLALAQWTPPRAIDPSASRGQGAPLITVSKSGVIGIVCQEGSGSNDSGRHVVYRSTDNGLSFQRGAVLIPHALDYIMDPPYAIAFDTTGALWVLWGWDWLPGGLPVGSYLELSKSTNNGLSFMTMVRHWRGLIVKPSRMIIDAHNNIHLLHDSLVAGVGPKVVYTRFADANPNNRFDALAPMTALAEWGGDADLAVTPPSSIHYTAVIQTEVPGPNEFRINYARSTDGGGTFSALVVIDSITRPEQISPRIMSRESLVVLAYRVDSSMSHLAVVSTNNGLAFSDPFGFGSDYYGLPGKITSDSQNVYLFYPTYEHPFTGRGRTVFNRFTDPFSPPEEIARFDSLFGDLAIGPTGGKYAAFQKQGIRSALFTGKDIPTSVENARTRLIQAYLLCASPNPFNSSTTLFLDLPITSDIQVRLFNILGQQLYLEERKHVLPGRHAFFVNSSNLTSGIYIANVVTRERSLSLKLLHLK